MTPEHEAHRAIVETESAPAILPVQTRCRRITTNLPGLFPLPASLFSP
jgi:hypothetical protein